MTPPPQPETPSGVGLPVLVTLTLAVTLLAMAASGIFARFPFNGNEGWNALHALDAMRGTPLYRFDGLANFNNYPPLGFYIFGAAGALVGDIVFAGRLLSLASQLAVTLIVGLLVLRLGGSRLAALAAAGLVLLFAALAAPRYIVVADPQWLAHVPQLLGLLLLLAADPGRLSFRRLALVFGLLLVGGLIKHNLVALPVAITIWLMLRDRRAIAAWLALAAISLPLLGLFAQLLYGPDIFAQILGHRRLLGLGELGFSGEALLFLIPPALLAGRVAWTGRGAPGMQLLGIYLLAAALFGLFFALGRGVAANAWFDLAFAVLPLTAIALGRLGMLEAGWLQRGRPRHLLLAIPALLPALLLLPGALGYYGARLSAADYAAEVEPVIAALRDAPGPVACEDPTFCYWAGRDNAVDFTNAGQRMLLDATALAEFEALLATRQLALLQLYDATSASLPAAANAAIGQYYAPVTAAPVHLYAPR